MPRFYCGLRLLAAVEMWRSWACEKLEVEGWFCRQRWSQASSSASIPRSIPGCSRSFLSFFPMSVRKSSWLFHRSLSTVSDTRRYRLVRVHQGSPPLPTIAGIRRQLDTRFAIVLRISISISHEPFIIGSVSKNLMVLPTVLRRYRERAMHCVEDDFDRCD